MNKETVARLRQEYEAAMEQTMAMNKKVREASRVWEAAQEAHQDAYQAEEAAWVAYQAAKRNWRRKNDTQN